MSGVSSTDQAFINRLTGIILANLENEYFGVDELAHSAGLSRSAIYHRLLAITEKSTTQFIREVRLQRAMEILQHEDITVSEVAYKVGFGSPAYFNTSFHEYFGYPPGEAKNRNIREVEGNNSIIAINGNDEAEKLVQIIPIRKIFHYTTGGFLALFFVYLFFNNLSFENFTILPGNRLKTEDKSIAVQLFKSLSSDQENQYFAEGVTRNILYNLIQISEIKVINSPVKELEGNTLNLNKMAGKLNVRFFLSGSVQKSGEQVLIMVQLTDISKNQIIWSEKFPRKLSDIFQIQSDIAKQVADQLQSVLSPQEKEQIEKIPTKNTEAYNLYLMGRFFWNRRSGYETDEGLKKSIEYFTKAIEIDPDYAQAWSGLADAYNFLAGGRHKPWQEQGEQVKAKHYALRALKIDKNSAEAHTSLGFILSYRDWKWEEALKELTLAIKLNPNYAFAHQILAQLFDITGDYKKAREEIDLALNLDPLNSIMHRISGDLYYNQGNFDESLKEFQEALAIEKNYTTAYWGSFYAYYRLGNGDKALDELQKILLMGTLTSKYVDVADRIYTKSGLDGLIDWMIEIFSDKIDLYAIAGKKEKALTFIEGLLKNDSGDELVRLINRLNYESLRSEPRFKAVIEKLGLTEYYLKRLNDPGYIRN